MNKWFDFIKVNKMFVKILLSFLSLLIPIVIFGLITYANFVEELKKEYAEKMELHLTSSTKTVESYWNRIYEAGVNFYGDPAARRLLRTSALHNDESRAELQQLFQSIDRTKFHVNQFTDDLFVYVDGSYVMTSSGANDFYWFFNKFHRYMGLDADYWLAALHSEKSIEILKPANVQTSFQKKSVFSVLVRNIAGQHRAVLVATVPVTKVLEAMQPVLDQGATEVLIVDGDGGLVLSTSEQFANIQHMKDNDHYIVSSVMTDTFNWTYYAITPTSVFQSQAKGILRLITGISIVLCLVGVAVAFLFSLNLYRPIRRIVELFLEEDRRKPWSGDLDRTKRPNDLHTIGDGIRQLITYRDHYLDEWQVMARDYMDHALHQIIRGTERNRKRDEELVRMMQTHLQFRKESYLCCAITFEFKESFFEEIQDFERIVIENKMKNLILGYLSQFAQLYILENNDHLYLCIVNVDSEEESARFKNGLEQFLRTFEYDMKYYSIRIGVGLAFAGLDGIAKSYRGAMSALRTVQPAGSGGTVPAQIAYATDAKNSGDVHYTYADENKLLKALKFGSKEDVELAVEDLLVRTEHSLLDRNALIDEMYGTAARFTAERGIDAAQLLDDADIQGGVSALPTEAKLAERQQRLLAYLFGIIDAAFSSKTASYKSNTLAQTIKQYVEENYTMDVHLEHIADKMGVSVKYVSRVFKEHFNTNLSDYISELRIRLAKDLLEHSAFTVNDISEKAGFFNRTTFLRTFKKLEGKSPNQYRQEIRDRSGLQSNVDGA
ncbi:helix-turn-helix domain-containing protein [Paenibacillus silvisoli]|uniref:helix-turn-helix domain-containing protein n=1 Tax=Paenibacillus silvisoli TaxID=3110539 RepID=UPI002804A50D|nr:helix-turn-helix domain-containing protein [Paenibacillus silvisoli]